MSSIISDIFYGSKQNLLDNYLVNRQEQQQSSIPRDQPSGIYTPFIQLTISVPNTKKLMKPQYLNVRAEMGTKSDENMLQILQGNDMDTPSVVISLNDLQKQDLNRYPNIKLTLSEGKYKNKVFAYIPIQTIKTLINYTPSEKTLTLQVKGKKFIGFGSIQCIIRAQFPSNHILNSEIMRSGDKEYSYLERKKEGSRELGEVSDLSYKTQSYWDSQQGKERQTRPLGYRGLQGKRVSPHRHKLSSNIYIEDDSILKRSSIANRSTKPRQPITQFMGQVKAVKLQFSSIRFTIAAKPSTLLLKCNESIFKLNEVVQFDHFSKEGLQIELISDEGIVGRVHLSVLLLTLKSISGDLPIYSESQQCIGTIRVQNQVLEPQIEKQVSLPLQLLKLGHQGSEMEVNPIKQMLVLNIQKIVLLNSTNILNNESSYDVDPQKWQHFDFSKIQASNHLQVIVRVGETTFKFNDIVLRYTVDRDDLRVVELRRKEGFIIQSIENCTKEGQRVEIQLYNNYRLLTYSSMEILAQNEIGDYFVAGQTDFVQCNCSIHIQSVSLAFQEDYFQVNHLKTVTNILTSLLTKQLKLHSLCDQSIKKVMNTHKKATYTQTKKLFLKLTALKQSLMKYQEGKFQSIISSNHEHNEHFIRFAILMLRQLRAMDVRGQQCIDRQQFQRVVNFYRSQYLSYQSEEFEKLLGNLVQKNEGRVLYPFFISGHYLIEGSISSIEEEQSGKQQKQNQVINNQKQIPNITQIAVLAQPYYYIQKIIFKNMHLTNNGKVPNISLSISKRVHYSNSNPEFIIQKEVNLMQTVKVYNKSIVHNELILLAQFQLKRRQIHYQLDISGRSMATVIWGL